MAAKSLRRRKWGGRGEGGGGGSGDPTLLSVTREISIHDCGGGVSAHLSAVGASSALG